MLKKYTSVNYLRCIACLFVINTHISVLYPSSLSSLAFGGFFGNCIFFFVSGFCLSKPKDSFPKWYLHRFIRVYTPYILFVPILFFANKLQDLTWYQILLPYKNYHFIPTILAIYPIFYILSYIDEKTKFKYKFQLITVAVIQLVQYIFFFDYGKMSVLTHFSFPETTAYIIIMLLGVMIKQKNVEQISFEKRFKNVIKDKKSLILSALLIFSMLIYVVQSLKPFGGILKILQIYIGIAFSFSLSVLLVKFENFLPKIALVDAIATLTLESYLVQFISRDAFASTPFPVGLLYHLIATIAVAFCLNFISRKILKLTDNKNK